jgi:Na+-transporting NADH:ubiquinone oxidoreductase subunit B
MKFLRKIQDLQAPLFHKGGKLEKLYPLYEANDTFLFTPGEVTKGASHVRDGIDLKRMMFTVVVALIPCIIAAVYNTGYQANSALAEGLSGAGWRGMIMDIIGIGYSQANPISCIIHGLLYYLPIFIVTFVVGGHIEALFAVVRKHEINEGFLVTGMLFPLILPPTIPLWQVAAGIAFGVIIGKEVFGGTGMNILNPALTARAFLFFAYPAQISGDKVWVAITEANQVDGFSGATALGRLSDSGITDPAVPGSIMSTLDGMGVSWSDAFFGTLPGSMGEACFMGAFVLIVTGVGSWRTMLGIVIGSLGFTMLMNAIGSDTNALMNLPFHWHIVLGGWAFGAVFMATDPVSSAYTDKGKLIYGFFIGVFAILIRVLNPAYPEGMMLAILFMNVFAPTIDYCFKRANIRRREERSAV